MPEIVGSILVALLKPTEGPWLHLQEEYKQVSAGEWARTGVSLALTLFLAYATSVALYRRKN